MKRGKSKGGTASQLGFMDDLMETAPLFNCAPDKAYDPLFISEEEVVVQEEFERMTEEQFRTGSTYSSNAEDNYENKSSVDGTVFEPSAIGPTIWKVECMVGRERYLAFCMMQKFIDLRSKGIKLQIISAFAVDHVKGFVFVEADKLCDVDEACKGLPGIFSSQMKPVHKNETSQLLASWTRSTEIAVCASAGVKSGNYKGDLGQGREVTTKKLPTTAPRMISTSKPKYKEEILLQLYDDNKNRKSMDSNEGDGSAVCIGRGGSSKGNRKVEGRSGGKEGSSGHTGIGKGSSGRGGTLYEPYDLVCFGTKDFGLVLGVEKDGTYKILKECLGRSSVVTVSPNDIKHLLSDVKFTALDQRQKNICLSDTVKVLEGPLKGRRGIVKQVYNGTVFMFDENETENGGYFCSKAQGCEKVNRPVVGRPEKVGPPIAAVEDEDKCLKGTTVAAIIVQKVAYIVGEGRSTAVDKNERGEEVAVDISSGQVNKIPKLNKYMVAGMAGNADECNMMVQAMRDAVGDSDDVDLALQAGENFVTMWKHKTTNIGKLFPSRITLIGWDRIGPVIHVIGKGKKQVVRAEGVVVATGKGKKCVKDYFRHKKRGKNEADCLVEGVVLACCTGTHSGGKMRMASIPDKGEVDYKKSRHIVSGVSWVYDELRDYLVRWVLCVSHDLDFCYKQEEALEHKIRSTVGDVVYQILGVNFDIKYIVRLIVFPSIRDMDEGLKKLERTKFLKKSYTLNPSEPDIFKALAKKFSHSNLKIQKFL